MTASKGAAPPAGDDARARLLRSATELFARKGYSATTVREIVEAAGVTKPVLYYYFKSKEGLYLELMQVPHTRFMAMLDESLEGSDRASAKIRMVLERGYDLLIENRDLARVGYAIYFGPPQGAPFFDYDAFHLKLQEAVHVLVREGINNGEFRDGDAEAMTLSIVAVQTLATQLELSRAELSLGREGVGRLLDVLFHGLINPDNAKGKRKRK